MASSARIDELQKKFDENPRRYFAPLANEYRKAGDLERAIHICQEYLPQQPGHMSGHIVYGQALFELARLDESRQVFETALSLDPENLIALRHLGDIARQVGDTRTARSWYQRVLEADPRNEEIAQIMMTLLSTPSVAQPGINGGSSYETSEMPAPSPAQSEGSGELAGFQPTGLGVEVEKSEDRSGLSVGPELAALPERQPEPPAWTPPSQQIPEEELLDLNDFDFSVGGVRLSDLGPTPSIDQPPVAEETRVEGASDSEVEVPSEPEIEGFTEAAAFVASVEPDFVAETPAVIQVESDTGFVEIDTVIVNEVATDAAAEASAAAAPSEEPAFEADPFAIAAAPVVEEAVAESVEIPPVDILESYVAAMSPPETIPGLESFEHGVSAPEEVPNALEFEEFFLAAPTASEPESAEEEAPMEPVAEAAEPVFEAGADVFVEMPATSFEEAVADPFAETFLVVDVVAAPPVEEPVVEAVDAMIEVVDELMIEGDEPAVVEAFDAPMVVESFEMPDLETMSGEPFGVPAFEAPDETIASFDAPDEPLVELQVEPLIELPVEPFVASELEIETAPDVDWLTPAAQAAAIDEIVASTSEPEWQSNATTWDTPLATPAISEAEAAPVEAEAFVTETMAELYLQQGHLEAALDIYKKLVEQRPDEPQLVERLRILQEQFFGRPTPIISPAVVAPPSPPPASIGPTIREFLSGLIAARPMPMDSETASEWTSPAADESGADAFDAPLAAMDAVEPESIPAEPASIEEEFGEPYEPTLQPVAYAAATPTSIPVVDAALEAVIDFSEQPMIVDPADEPLAEPATVIDSVIEISLDPTPQPAAGARTPSVPAETVRGSIDALFSSASESSPDANAAATLAQAFTPTAPETDPLQGTPAHKASNELSLDHVFKSTQPARADGEAEGFSFDQFFAEDLAEGTNKAGSQTPSAPRQGAEDIAQFNNWLNGLKKT